MRFSPEVSFNAPLPFHSSDANPEIARTGRESVRATARMSEGVISPETLRATAVMRSATAVRRQATAVRREE